MENVNHFLNFFGNFVFYAAFFKKTIRYAKTCAAVRAGAGFSEKGVYSSGSSFMLSSMEESIRAMKVGPTLPFTGLPSERVKVNWFL